MSNWRKRLGVVTASGAILGAAVLGVDLFHDGQFALAAQQVTETRAELADVQDASTLYRDIHRAVEPSVVEIRVTKTLQGSESQEQQVPPNVQRFFHEFGNGNGNGQFNLPPQFFNFNGQAPMREIGTGSGVIMDVSDGYGYVLTNNHVAGGASDIVVTLADGRVIKNAQLVGADPRTDLAVLKIKADHLIPAVWGDSTKLEPGDQILAFGAPFGYVGSMTHGIVSALHRQAGILGSDGYEDFIQVDAPINPGNSGGPLVNLKGDVVGINTAIASSSGGFQGIGFAIPSEEARPIYEQLKESGRVALGWLGVRIENVTNASDEAASEGYKGYTGVLVQQVLRNSPSQGILQPGDIVTGLNGKDVNNVVQLRDGVSMDKPGTEVTLRIFRDGRDVDVNVKIGQEPNDLGELASANTEQTHSSSDLGLQLGNVNDDVTQEYSLTDKSGAVVTAVTPGSPAAEAGIQEGDVITNVDHHPVRDVRQAERELSKADLKNGVQLQIDNRQGSEFVFVKTG